MISISGFLETLDHRIPIIIGPTGSGKSTLALALSAALGGDIIAADSVTVYRLLNIFSAKPSASQRSTVRHHMLDLIHPDQQYDAGKFSRAATDIVQTIKKSNRTPIVCGGTPLYIRALAHGLIPSPPIDADVKQKVESLWRHEGLPAVYDELKRLDPMTSRQLHPNDRQRILRALEIFYAQGKSISILQEEHGFNKRRLRALYIMPNVTRETIYKKINRRTQEMVDAGGIEETRSVLEMGYADDCPGLRTIGYKQAVTHIRGKISLDDMIRDIATRTRNYAKRQQTWYRDYQNVIGVEPGLSVSDMLTSIQRQILRKDRSERP